ncbi:hypothetical protein GGS20DRAFT_58843 [Poronia punctata]|nr:hypothetical protein GGS20DRAFT_58843 [Poronia punctata]
MSSPPNPQITLFRGWKTPQKFVWSPYVTKLEARLRFGGLSDYITEAGSPRSAPRGKIPYIQLSPSPSSSNSTVVHVLSDSTLITKSLCEADILPDLSAGLSPIQRASDLALRALLEDKLAFYNSWERWTQNYHQMRDHVLSPIPYPIRIVIGLLAYRRTITTLHGQGTGRLAPDEIVMFRGEIWQSFSDLLLDSRSKQKRKGEGEGEGEDGEEPFWVLGGDDPTDADASLFGFVCSALICTAGPDSQVEVKSLPVLVDYACRIQRKYFPEYEPLPV